MENKPGLGLAALQMMDLRGILYSIQFHGRHLLQGLGQHHPVAHHCFRHHSAVQVHYSEIQYLLFLDRERQWSCCTGGVAYKIDVVTPFLNFQIRSKQSSGFIHRVGLYRADHCYQITYKNVHQTYISLPLSIYIYTHCMLITSLTLSLHIASFLQTIRVTTCTSKFPILIYTTGLNLTHTHLSFFLCRRRRL